MYAATVEEAFASGTASPVVGTNERPLSANVVKSAGRAIQILEFFDLVQREATVSDVSTSLGYPQSSTSVLLRSLVAMGYLHHNRFKRTYMPTRRVSLLGNWLDASVVQQGSLLELVEGICLEAGETTVLAIMNALHVQYIYVQQSATEHSTHIVVGSLRELGRTAAGAALLSVFDDAYIGRLLRRANAERSPHERPIDAPAFMASITRGRKSGYFVGRGSGEGDSSIAAIIDRNKDGELLALAVEGPEGRLESRTDMVGSQIKAMLSNFVPRRHVSLT